MEWFTGLGDKPSMDGPPVRRRSSPSSTTLMAKASTPPFKVQWWRAKGLQVLSAAIRNWQHGSEKEG